MKMPDKWHGIIIGNAAGTEAVCGSTPTTEPRI